MMTLVPRVQEKRFVFQELSAEARPRALQFFGAYLEARRRRAYERPTAEGMAELLAHVGASAIALWEATPPADPMRLMALHSAAVAGHSLATTQHKGTAMALLDFALDNDDGYLGQNRQALAAAHLLCDSAAEPTRAAIDPSLIREPAMADHPLRLELEGGLVLVLYWLGGRISSEDLSRITALVEGRQAGGVVVRDGQPFLRLDVPDDSLDVSALQETADAAATLGAALAQH